MTANEICTGFAMRKDPVYAAIRMVLFYLPPLTVAILVLKIVSEWRNTGNLWRGRDSRRDLQLIAGYFLVPIGLVNMILKEVSGRPRPYQTIDFGGALQFHAAGDFGGLCNGNCSFLSGEAAAAGWLVCLLPLIDSRRQPLLFAFIVAASVATPVLRVVMGGHYASDALLGWLLGASACPIASLLFHARDKFHKVMLIGTT